MANRNRRKNSGSSQKNDASSKKKRRPRSAAGERNYVCGCGKAYLSYPALYTHVKNKHKGTFPEGSNLKKKFRKKSEDAMNATNYIDLEKKNYKDRFIDFLRGLDGAYAEKSGLQSPQLTTLIPKESFPDDSYWKPMVTLLEKTIEKGETESIRTKDILDLKEKSELNCDQILGRFILHTSDLFTESLYKEFIILLCMFRKALSEKGKLYRLKDPNQMEIEGEFCESNYIEVAPEVANLFIAEIYPNYFSQMKNKLGFKYLGDEGNAIMFIINMTKFLCNWLLIHGFTNIKVEINSDP